MTFGDRITSADTAAAADWLGLSRGEFGTVGWLVPNHFDSMLHVSAPAPDVAAWWGAYCELFQLIAAIGQQHTANPDQGWFAIWEGHGFDNATSHIAWSDPRADDAEHHARALERTRRREESERRNAELRHQLNRIPRFERVERVVLLAERTGRCEGSAQSVGYWLAEPGSVLARRSTLVRCDRRGLLVGVCRWQHQIRRAGRRIGSHPMLGRGTRRSHRQRGLTAAERALNNPAIRASRSLGFGPTRALDNPIEGSAQSTLTSTTTLPRARPSPT